GGCEDRGILVQHVVHTYLQEHAAEDLIAAYEVEIIAGTRPLDGRSERAREQRRRVRQVDLGIADMTPPRLQSDSMPGGRPTGRERVSPLRQWIAAGGTEVTRAIVLARPGVGLRYEGGRVGADEVEAQRPEVAHALGVVERYVHSARLLESEIERRVLHIAELREPDRARRVAVDHGAELRIVVEH